MTRRDLFGFLRGSAAAAVALPAVTSIERLDLNPEDSIVLKFDSMLSRKHIEYIRDEFKKACNGRFKDVSLLILDRGTDISVLRKH